MIEVQQTIPKTSIRFWSNYLIQMRPYLFFISGAVGMAGISMSGEFSFHVFPSILVFIALFFSYGFGQALTDCYQTDTDKLSAPYRPLSQGILSIQDVKTISVMGLLTVATIVSVANPINILLCVLAILATWTYTYVKRHLWFLAPGYNSFIIMLIGFMGYLSLRQGSILELLSSDVLKLGALIFFSYSNFVLIGYLKDISADRKTGYQTFPVKFGWNKTLFTGDLVLLICAFIYFNLVDYNLISLIIGVVGIAVGVVGQLHAHFVKEKKEENSALAIVNTVRTMVLLLLGVIVSFQTNLVPFTIIYYLIFELFMLSRPMRSQI